MFHFRYCGSDCLESKLVKDEIVLCDSEENYSSHTFDEAFESWRHGSNLTGFQPDG